MRVRVEIAVAINLYLGRQEQTGRCDAVPREVRERVERIEAVHVHNGRVDA